MNDREKAAAWAANLLDEGAALILDTETTGLGHQAEIVQIAIIDLRGQVLLDTLVRPTRAIPADAQRIHGITDQHVADAPTIADLAPQLRELLSGQTIVIYNAAYDTRLLEQSLRAHDLTYALPVFAGKYVCAMEEYSAWVGEWNDDWHGNYRWQRLPEGDHSALGDARATLAVLKRMAESLKVGQ